MKKIVIALLLTSTTLFPASVNVYDAHALSNWVVYIDSSISEPKGYLSKLEKSLKFLDSRIPKHSFKFLRDNGLKIVITPTETIGGGVKMLYVPSGNSNWTRKYEKFLDCSIAIPVTSFKARNFNFSYYLSHELAHHYHFTLVGYTNEHVWRKYWIAKRTPNYPILYGLNNHTELFAELSANFFVMRADLAKIDKDGLDLMKYLWGEKFFNHRMKLFNSLPTVDMPAIIKLQTERENRIFTNTK